jgi:hypothetical protein
MSKFDGMSIAEMLQTKECKELYDALRIPLEMAQKNMKALHFFQTEDSLCHLIVILRQAYEDPEMQECLFGWLDDPKTAKRANIPIAKVRENRKYARNCLDIIFKRRKDMGYQAEIVTEVLMRIEQKKMAWLLFIATLVGIFDLSKTEGDTFDEEAKEFYEWLKNAKKAFD